MMIRSSWLLLIPLWLLTCLAGHVKAEIRIESRPSPRLVHAQDYQARIDWDGCLTNLKFYGQEFLASNVSISRGSYFFYLDPLQLSEINQPEANVIVANGDLASIKYTFSDQGLNWQLVNHSNVDLVYFMVFAAGVEGFQEAQGEIMSLAITADASTMICYRGNVRLQVDGFSRIWGPWQGPHQVGQVDLKPGEKKNIRIRFGKMTPEEHQEIIKLSSHPPDSKITILSPRSYQVFQRRTMDEGEILVSGRCGEEVDQLEIRVSGESRDGPLPNQWVSVPVLSNVREFNTRLPVPAGGWYSLHVRAKNDSSVVAEKRVDQFGVGEVFVGAGQSNSINSGEFQTKQKTGMVSSFGGENWQIADDPQLGVADSSQGGSFWPAFGGMMYGKYKVPIGVATTGYGRTSVNQWKPDGDLFKWMMTRVHQLGPSGFRAFLWHQGESDVEMPSDEYYTKLRKVIVTSQDRAGWEFPWFVAQASYHNPEKLQFDNVRHAQQRLWNDSVALPGPDTDTLTGDHRDLGGKGIHFSPKGLKAHGHMWAERVSPYLDEVLSHGLQ